MHTAAIKLGVSARELHVDIPRGEIPSTEKWPVNRISLYRNCEYLCDESLPYKPPDVKPLKGTLPHFENWAIVTQIFFFDPSVSHYTIRCQSLLITKFHYGLITPYWILLLYIFRVQEYVKQ